MNMIATTRSGNSLSAQGVELAATDAQRAALRAMSGQDVVYGLRPEDLEFGDGGLAGTLTMIEPTGPETYVTTDTAVGKLTARVSGHVHAHVGEHVHLQWQPAKAHLFDAANERRLA